MSGTTARRGFRFQDYYLLRQVLDDLAARRSAALAGLQQPELVTFGVETPLHAQAGTPDWDTLIIGARRTEVIEVKSGQVSREDRRAFWLRLRSELISAGGGQESILPVLVTNADSEPAGITWWRELDSGAASGHIDVVQVPITEPAQHLISSEILVKEALYWLCGPTEVAFQKRDGTQGVKPLGPVVPQDVARAALKRFKLVEVHDTTLEREVETKLDLLTVGHDSAHLRRHLRGWLDDRATALAGAVKYFTSEDLLQEVEVLQRLLSGSPDAFALARALRQRYTTAFVTLCEERATHTGGLYEVPLDTAQPALSQHDWSMLTKSVVIVGDAGQGKSQVLLQLYRKVTTVGDVLQVVAVGAEAIAEYLGSGATAGVVLSETLQLLADLAALQGHRVTMLVDGIDQVGAETSARLADILNSASNHPAFKAIVSCRRPDWHSRQKLQAHMVGWEQMDLSGWNDTLVDHQLERAGVTRNLTTGLRQLARNPLYLDLLVRTFGQGNPVPPDLQTRHGLFRAFWDVRVFGDNQELRWQLLTEGCKSIASSGAWSHTTADPALIQEITQLVSTGVLVRINNRGQYGFRHPLLRDFAMAQWVLAGGPPDSVRQRIHDINSPLHRFGAQRALIEAVCESGQSPYASAFGLRDYIGDRPTRELLDEVSDILGELTPSADMDPQVWATDLTVDVASRLIRSAQYHLNFEWIRLLTAWPANPAWPDQQGWLGADTLRALVDYGLAATNVALKGDFKSGGILLPRLATLVREWTCAQRFTVDMQQGNLPSRVIPLIARWQIDDSSFRWLAQRLDAGTWHTRLELLEAIPVIAEGVAREQPNLVDSLVSLYRSAIGLPEGQIDLDQNVWNYPTMDYRAANWCLIGVTSSGGVPLLDALPKAFLPVTLDLLVATARQKIVESAKWSRRIERHEGELEPDLGQTDAKAESVSETGLGESESLLDDHPDGFWRRQHGDDLHTTLLSALKRYMEKWLKDDPTWFVSEACPLIRRCRVATVQSLLIHLRLEISSDPRTSGVIREMLWDRGLYECVDLLYWMDRLLQVEWAGLTETERLVIFSAVRRTVNTNPFNRILIGQFLSGLPSADLPADLVSLVDEANASGFAPFYGDPRRDRIDTFSPVIPRPKITTAVIGTWHPPISQADMGTFYERCSDLPFNDVPAPTAEQVIAAIAITQAILPSVASDVIQLVTNPWPLHMLELVVINMKRYAEAHATEVDVALLSAIAELAVSCLEHSPIPSAEGDLKAFQTRYHKDSWSRSLSLADLSLGLDALKERKDLRDRVFVVLTKAFRTKNPVAQMIGLLECGEEHWLRMDEGLAELLEEFMMQHVQVGPVLETSIGLLYAMDFKSSDRLVRALLTRSDLENAHDFCFALGQYLGIRSLVVLESGARLPAATLLGEISAHKANFALLAEPENSAGLLWGIAKGLSIQADHSVRETFLARDYAKWLSWVWGELQQYPWYREKDRPSNFMLHCLYWLGNSDHVDASIRERRTWWSDLVPLVQTVIRSGRRNDVHSTMFNLRGQLATTICPPTDLLEVVQMFVHRLQGFEDPAELDATRPDEQEWHSWRDCALYAAEVVDDVCRRMGLPGTELGWGYKLLQALAADPIRLQDALRRLAALRSDLETSL